MATRIECFFFSSEIKQHKLWLVSVASMLQYVDPFWRIEYSDLTVWVCRLICNVNCITKTRLYKYIENFTTKEKENFQIKKSDIFHYSAQNIDCGYSLEPPRRGGSNEYPQSMFLSRNKKIMYTPLNPSFTI